MSLEEAAKKIAVPVEKVISWDLSKDVSNIKNIVGTLQIKVFVDIHVLGPGNNTYNYVFMNPTILANTASNLHIRGIHLYINGNLAGTVTAYNVVDVILPKANTKTLISGIGQAYLMDLAPTDALSLELDIIESTSDTPTLGLPVGP